MDFAARNNEESSLQTLTDVELRVISKGQLSSDSSADTSPASSLMTATEHEHSSLLSSDQESTSLAASPHLRRRFYLPQRIVFAVLCFVCILINYADRTNISVAIIPMATEYKWDKVFEGWVLSSFWYGYGSIQLVAGFLSDRYGGKNVLNVGAFLWSVFTVLTPIAAHGGPVTLIICRVLMGMGEGVSFPAIHSMISKWIPIHERSRVVALITSGCYFGSLLPMIAAPHLIVSAGWESVFYVFGGVGFLWCVVWFFIGASTPEEHRWIHPSEREYINSHLATATTATPATTAATPTATYTTTLAIPTASENGTVTIVAVTTDDDVKLSESPTTTTTTTTTTTAPPTTALRTLRKKFDVPWRKLLLLPAVWAIMINQFCGSYSGYILLAWLPTWFHDYLQVEMDSLNWYTALPYLVQGIIGMGSGWLADLLIKRRVKTSIVRKIFQSAGLIIPGALFSVLSWGNVSTAWLGMLLISVALGSLTLTLAGVSVNNLDISHKYSAVIFGLGNTAATVSAVIGTPLTGWILETTGSWQWVFISMIISSAIGALSWLTMSKAELLI